MSPEFSLAFWISNLSHPPKERDFAYKDPKQAFSLSPYGASIVVVYLVELSCRRSA